jgi:hypothetical protein
MAEEKIEKFRLLHERPQGKKKTLVLTEPYWEKQYMETAKQFAAFVMYRDTPALEREMIEIARRLKKHHQVIYKWANMNKWRVRAGAYDLKIDRDLRAIAEKSKRERFEMQMELAQGLAMVGGAAVQQKLSAIKAREENPDIPFEMTDKDAERWIDSGMKWMRVLDNLPTGHMVIETPEMMKERLLREAVADVTELYRLDPKISLEDRIKWAVEDYPGLDEDLLSAAVHGHIEQVSAMEN